MKTKGLKISLIFFVISALLLSPLMFLQHRTKDETKASEDIKNSSYLFIDDDENYKSSIMAGRTQGYGHIVVGEEANLQTTANQGFKVMGWSITDNLHNTPKIFVTETGDVEIAGEEIGITVDVQDKDADGYNEFSNLTIQKVNTNLTVEPVFDFIYYSADITALFPMSSLDGFSTLSIGTSTVYYADSHLDDKTGITRYEDAILLTSENKYIYLDDIYCDAGNYYSLHETLPLEGETKEQKITIDFDNVGTFRLNDEVKLELSVDNVSGDLLNSQNIDIKGLTLGASSLLELEELTNIIVNKDSYNRSLSFSVDFNILHDQEYVNTLNYSAHNLYVATLDIFVDNVLAVNNGVIENEKTEILNNLTITNYYADCSNGVYLVKNARDNENNKVFTINARKKIVNGIYEYYTLQSLQNAGGKTFAEYFDFVENTTIQIKYTAVKYDITFKFAQKANDVIQENTGFNIPSSLMKSRGQGVELLLNGTAGENQVVAPINYGYKCLGFIVTTNGIIPAKPATGEDNRISASTSAIIDKTEPKPLTVFVVYELIDYKVVLTNYNKITLNSAYPLQFISLMTKNTEYVIDAEDLLANTNKVEFNTSLNIGDNFTLFEKVNNGFATSYKIGNETNQDYVYEINNVEKNNIVLNEEFIEKYLSDNNYIYVNVTEEYVYYTATYFIDAIYDDAAKESVLMADISVEIPNTAEQQQTTTSGKDLITITGLKYGETVTFKSLGNSNVVNGSTETYKYIFVRFTGDGLSSLSYGVDGNYVNHTRIVTENLNVQVQYSLDKANITISLQDGFNEAYNLSNISIEQDGESVTNSYNEITNPMGYEIEMGSITIDLNSLDKSLNALFAVGYRYLGYTINNVPVVSSNLEFIVGINGYTSIVLNFEKINYTLNITQNGYTFANSDDKIITKTISIQDVFIQDKQTGNAIEFTMPDGYYVGSITENVGTKLNGLLQDNSYVGTLYSHILTKNEFENLIAMAENDIIYLNFNYSIHTYKIVVNIELINPKGDSIDSKLIYPNIDTLEKFDKVSTVRDNYAFNNIPYNSNATLTATNLDTGLSNIGWYNKAGMIALNNDKLEIVGVKENLEITYKISYAAYNIAIKYFTNQGAPRMFVNNVQQNVLNPITVSKFDKFDIDANPTKTNGFKFINMYYYKQYIYDENEWGDVYSTLYIMSNDDYVLNTVAEYDDTKNYFIKVDINTKNGLYDVDGYTDEEFLYETYRPVNKDIVFTLVYDYMNITINNVNQNEKGSSLQGIGNVAAGSYVNLPLEEYSEFEVLVKRNNAEYKDIAEYNNLVRYGDTIQVIVTLNSSARFEYNKLGDRTEETYDLNLGLSLVNSQVAGINYVANKVGGKYILEFNLEGAVINNVEETEILNIKHFYRVAKKSVLYKSNIDHKDFFNKFSYQWNKDIFTSESPQKKIELQTYNSFLNLSTYTYINNHNNGSSRYYRIRYMNVYLGDSQVPLSKEEYFKYGVVRVDMNSDRPDEINLIAVRYLYDLRIELQIEPVILFNGAEEDQFGNMTYSKTYQFNAQTFEGVGQGVTVGSKTTDNIQLAPELAECLTVTYTKDNIEYTQDDLPINVGVYNIALKFAKSKDYPWLENIKLSYSISLNIQQKEIYLTYTINKRLTKVYDDTNDFSFETVRSSISLFFSDDTGFKTSINNQDFISLNMSKCRAVIDAVDGNVGTNYNIKLSGFSINSTNFKLRSSDLVVDRIIDITQAEFKLVDVQIYDKVYDGTVAAKNTGSAIRVIGLVNDSEDLMISFDKIIYTFETSEVGERKNILCDITQAISGKDANNYKFAGIELKSKPTIYPDKVWTTIANVGTITIHNNLGKQTDIENNDYLNYVNLIPVNARLNVEIIKEGSQEYINNYELFSKYLSGNRIYEIGYKFYFEVGSERVEIPSGLTLEVPNVKYLTDVAYYTTTKSGSLEYSINEDNDTINIQLSDFDGSLNGVILARLRNVLELWQIILIIVGVVLLIVAIVVVFVVVRRRKLREYSKNDKI